MKNIENFYVPTYIAFIDFKKAFDCVDRDKLWIIMSRRGIPTHLITIIQKIYTENIIKVNTGNGISEDFRVITQGVTQGCPLSPVLFNIYLYEVIRIWFQKLKTSKYFKELIFNTLLFADDQFIICDTEYNLQKAVYLLYNIFKECNLEISTKKTKVLSFVGADHLKTKIIINDETLEKVTQFTYLRCSISYPFSSDVEFKLAKFLQRPVQSGQRSTHQVQRETFSAPVKIGPGAHPVFSTIGTGLFPVTHPNVVPRLKKE